MSIEVALSKYFCEKHNWSSNSRPCHQCNKVTNEQGGQVSIPKTKREKFAEDPDKFFHEDDIVMAVVRNEKGSLGICTGACPRIEMEQGLTRLTYKLYQMFQSMDMQAIMREKQRESGIITT